LQFGLPVEIRTKLMVVLADSGITAALITGFFVIVAALIPILISRTRSDRASENEKDSGRAASRRRKRDAPRLVSLTPNPATTGQVVYIGGTNLVPTGEIAPAARTVVMIQSLRADDAANTANITPDPNGPVTASSLSFVMPFQFAARTVAVRVVTADSVTTDPFTMQVD
jgi:hypothetical protein